jgi:hypothetical protein
MGLDTEIKDGSRVRVRLCRDGYHLRSFSGVCKGWTPGGKVRVLEDNKDRSNAYNSDDVKLIKQ